MTGLYILDENGNPTEVQSFETWALSMRMTDVRAAKTQVGESEVSTVFLGLNHAYNGGPPLLWETMVFGGPLDQVQRRCSGSREQAEAMHAEMCERVRLATAL